jgi:hypothetical protein
MVISAPMAPVKKLLCDCKNREIASTWLINERCTRSRFATALRFCSSQRLKHHSNFRCIFAALGRGLGVRSREARIRWASVKWGDRDHGSF